jgi:SpoVK/Ycf46/Vps4 family AAA+-type ATPase
MIQHNKQNAYKDKMNKWEAELKENGKISNEAEILTLIKNLSESDDKETISDLLTLIGLSRQNKHQKDSLALPWMEKAVRLNPNNKRAKAFISQYEWKKKKNLLDLLQFPPIRETDNRTAKKKTAEQYIDICEQFLHHAEEQLEQLNANLLETMQLGNQEMETIYRTLIKLLEKAIDETTALLKAVREYDQSITGVFYTSIHYETLKTHLENLLAIKKEWLEFFQEEKVDLKTEKVSPLDQLREMVGLESVKERVNDFYRFLKYQKERKSLGFQTKDELSLNMVLTGNPGTGKTTIARLLAKIYHELGVLPREEVVEVDRSQLVGAYVGQTEENVRAAVERAIGGVLFIDEAYSLKREGQTGNDYGQTAVDTLVSLMTGSEYSGKFAVILAGYPDEMRQFLDANPGLRSRFPNSNHIYLSDYSNEELAAIAEKVAIDNDYVLTEEAKLALEERLEKERVDETFGNARTARNLVLDAIFKKGSETVDDQNLVNYTILEKKDFEIDREEHEEKPMEQLENLIGLHTVKDEVKSLIAFVKMQQLRRMKGMPVVPIQLHSVFTGNPGTGKTTVAKIYAQLLKECGFLKRGHLIVGSRADFVAGYVGQTAIKTKKKIREALGGVLFIDEAYSLLGGSSGDFGKEVIDTLVDEMTKHNENLVVVLAGYPDEMELLLDSNPGLRSRFKKFIHFPDYTAEDLLEIMESYSTRYQYVLDEESKSYVRSMLTNITVNGNARFATNLIDEAIQAQALRLMSKMTDDDLTSSVLTREDVEKALNKLRNGE